MGDFVIILEGLLMPGNLGFFIVPAIDIFLPLRPNFTPFLVASDTTVPIAVGVITAIGCIARAFLVLGGFTTGAGTSTVSNGSGFFVFLGFAGFVAFAARYSLYNLAPSVIPCFFTKAAYLPFLGLSGPTSLLLEGLVTLGRVRPCFFTALTRAPGSTFSCFPISLHFTPFFLRTTALFASAFVIASPLAFFLALFMFPPWLNK